MAIPGRLQDGGWAFPSGNFAKPSSRGKGMVCVIPDKQYIFARLVFDWRTNWYGLLSPPCRWRLFCCRWENSELGCASAPICWYDLVGGYLVTTSWPLGNGWPHCAECTEHPRLIRFPMLPAPILLPLPRLWRFGTHCETGELLIFTKLPPFFYTFLDIPHGQRNPLFLQNGIGLSKVEIRMVFIFNRKISSLFLCLVLHLLFF